MRKSIILFSLFSILHFTNAFGQTNNSNIIYLLCNRDDLRLTVNAVSEGTKQVVISYFFTKNWTIWGNKQSQIIFLHVTNPVSDKQWGWIAASENIQEIKKLSNVMTLDQFLEKLNKPHFCNSLRTTKFVMLLGWANGKKFERYPVKIGTDIYDPSDLNIPEHKSSKH